MLITRICDTEHSHWPFSKHSASNRRPESPRMSDRNDLPLPVQPDWQGQYSYLPHHDSDIFSRPTGDNRNTTNDIRRLQVTGEGGPGGLDLRVKKEQDSPAGLRCTGNAYPRNVKHGSPVQVQPVCFDKAGDSSRRDPFCHCRIFYEIIRTKSLPHCISDRWHSRPRIKPT